MERVSRRHTGDHQTPPKKLLNRGFLGFIEWVLEMELEEVEGASLVSIWGFDYECGVILWDGQPRFVCGRPYY